MPTTVPDFETVWNDLTEIARRLKTIDTIDMKISNEIVDIKQNAIYVISERTGKKRAVHKEDVRADWEILISKGSLRNGEEKSWHGSIIAAFLSKLPYVGYSLRPRTLYIKR